MLTDDECKRIVQLLGMLGSDYDGEVLNAARLLDTFMRKNRLEWGAIVNSSAVTTRGTANRAAGAAEGRKASESKALNAAYQAGFVAGVKSTKRDQRSQPSYKDWARLRVEDDETLLSEWEIKFFGSFAEGRYALPTEKQHAIFVRVSERLGIALPERPENPQNEMPF